MATTEDEEGKWQEKEFLYTVLNLPVVASANEIKERYRALSIIFHPDKQRDERTKETATKRFYEIQRAYEVLSDPFLRTVYDTLGYDGLRVQFPPNIRELPQEELRKALTNTWDQLQVTKLEARVNSQGRVMCGVDLTPFFKGGWVTSTWYSDLENRLRQSRVVTFGVRHSFQKEVDARTKVTIFGKMNQGLEEDQGPTPTAPKGLPTIKPQGSVGVTVRHQYSQQLNLEATANFLRRQTLGLSATYADNENTFAATTRLGPSVSTLPPLTLSFGRRLFPGAFTHGTLALGLTAGRPSVSLGIFTPTMPAAGANITGGWACGLNLKMFDGGPSVNTEWGVLVRDRALQLKLGFDLSLSGLSGYISGEWSSESKDTGVSATVAIAAQGVSLRLTLSHLGQTVLLPIFLSTGSDTEIALFAAVIPATAYLVADHFILKPNRRAARIARRRALRLEFREQISEKKRQAEESKLLLRDTATRHTQAESDRNGLVILEASYVPIEDNEQPVAELALDVTIPLQALVHGGQLYIPGSRPKANIQGFYDPLPEAPKTLNIRYEFRGRAHYVEVADIAPVVLPMQEHLVEGGVVTF